MANKVYVVPEQGNRQAKVIVDKMPLATGIEYHNGSLYLATNEKIYRWDNVDNRLDNLGEPKVLYDKLPGGTDHSWKYLRIRDDKPLAEADTLASLEALLGEPVARPCGRPGHEPRCYHPRPCLAFPFAP